MKPHFIFLTFLSLISFDTTYKQVELLRPVEKAAIQEDILFSCSYVSSIGDDDCIPDNFGSFTLDNISVAIVLKKIMEVLNSDTSVKITANFIPYECNFPQPVFKALTKRSDSTRYILYTKNQLQELIRSSTNWVAFAIFAHEIGHHLYLHSLSNPKNLIESKQRELEADFFSGYVLHKLDASISQAQSGINAFTQHPSDELEEYSSHPSKVNRLFWVKKGFDYVDSSDATTSNLLNFTKLRERVSKEQIFNKTMELFHEKEFNEALSMLSKIEPHLNGKSQSDYYNARGVIRTELNDIIGAVQDFNMAIQFNNSNSEYFENRADAKRRSSQKVLQAESKEDLKIAAQLKMMERQRNQQK